MSKPVVHYTDVRDGIILVGYGVHIRPVDHPSELVSNTTWVYTSPVVAYDEDSGKIETRNTIYIPIKV